MRTGVSRSFLTQSVSGGAPSSRGGSTLPQHAPPDVFIDDTPKRRIPPKSASFSIFNRREDTSPLLPDRSPDANNMMNHYHRNNNFHHPMSPGLKNGRTSFRAAERGKTNLLPTSVSSSNMTPSANGGGVTMMMNTNRSRASSTSSFTINRRSNTTPHEQLQQMTQSLRSRKRSGGTNYAASDDEGGLPSFSSPSADQYRHSINGHQQLQQQQHRSSMKPTWRDTFGKTDKPMRKRELVVCLARSTMTIRRQHVFQALITCFVTFFVWDSYQKALATTEQLLIVKHEESMMMLHLKRLEEQSLNLHESIARLSQGSVGVPEQHLNGLEADANHHHKGSESFDGEIIKIQTKQLREMEDELDHEVKTLQAKIQHSDRANIVQTFGEGPVQVILDVFLPQSQQESSKISILLWYDTPHAAWTLIQQLNKGLWDDAVVRLDKNVAITLEPPHAETLKQVDFVEKGQKKHESWTVGLTETSQGGLGLFINLQDNTQYHKHDVCIGKVIDGFDTLQRLTRVARGDEVVKIRKATASHLTMKESAGLA
ncbi:hypothetical protein MPSEU_001086600 [Mayamaea pseudoterrestris]|nr:hypothetical protein MPSEU_001086600 [Mayamaea pseudoterrestris]